ncbi:MAG: hypothetical protein OXI96_03460 [Acidimicrobiaceae bacterium]|nr:hypothetical protein [Acidimicrobiaceae bacterium]
MEIAVKIVWLAMESSRACHKTPGPKPPPPRLECRSGIASAIHVEMTKNRR